MAMFLVHVGITAFMILILLKVLTAGVNADGLHVLSPRFDNRQGLPNAYHITATYKLNNRLASCPQRGSTSFTRVRTAEPPHKRWSGMKHERSAPGVDHQTTHQAKSRPSQLSVTVESSTNSFQDGQALLEFKKAIQADPLQQLLSWNTANLFSLCSWLGVTCNEAGRVISVELSGRYLTGNFGGSLGNLPLLEDLDLSNNLLNGSIPASLGSCHNLKILKLSGNSLTGRIPPELGRLKKLQILHLSNNLLHNSTLAFLSNFSQLIRLEFSSNGLSGNIPQELGKLKHLEVIDLSQNQLTGSIPVSFGNFSCLKWLVLSTNNLQGEIPSGFGGLQYLELLDLGENNLSGIIPSSVGNSSGLRGLRLYTNKLEGEIPFELGKLKNLLNLDLSENLLTGSIPISLGNCRSLGSLTLASNHLEGRLPSELSALSNVISLNLSNNRFSGTIHTFRFEAMSQLIAVNLSNNKLSGIIPSALFHVKYLSALFLANNLLRGDVISNFTDGRNCYLRVLSLAGNSLTGNIYFLDLCPQLMLLDVRKNQFSGRLSLPFNKLRELLVLDVSSNNFTGHIPPSVWELPKVKIINLSNNNFTGNISSNFSMLDGMKTTTSLTTRGLLVDGYELPVLLVFDVQLELWDKGITMNITYALSFFSFMSVSGNQLSGTIPSEIGDLKMLRSLNLSRNSFTGEIPITLASITSLESLDLSGNSLTGSIPPAICNMDGLQVLRLSRNNLSGRIPSGMYSYQTNTRLTFDTFFPGNEKLCGPPGNRMCSSESTPSSAISYKSSPVLGSWISFPAFLIGFGTGHVVTGLMILLHIRVRTRHLETRSGSLYEAERPTSYGLFH